MLELELVVVQQGLLALRVGPTGMERWEPAGVWGSLSRKI